ncbi:phosphodiesterase [Xylophilus sp. GW821-FHT01B05]
MATHPTAIPAPADDSGEDLLSLWADLESGLSVVLTRPFNVQDFPQKVLQYDRWMQALVLQDLDTALYLLFQLASTSSVGYSASHALVCAALCHIVADELKLPRNERDVLVHAAMTMNIAMTDVQDRLSAQKERPNAQQRMVIEHHAADGSALLTRLGVTDSTWIDVVRQHHAASDHATGLTEMAPADRLAHVLRTIDRYAAMISPRTTRTGRSALDSVRAILDGRDDYRDEVGYALVRAVGLCPPGTFVELDNGETAVVVRRSETANQPVVAVVLDAQRQPMRRPRLHRVSAGSPRIRSALTHAQLGAPLNYRVLLQIGVQASRHIAALDAARPKPQS